MKNRFEGMDEDDIVYAMGWNEETMLIHMREFIHRMEADEAFAKYLAQVAHEEDADCTALEAQ